MQDPSTTVTRMKHRLPFKAKPIVPENAEGLLEKLRGGDYPKKTSCWKCGQRLILEEQRVEWAIGGFGFIFDGVPAYRCSTCEQTYFPGPVLDALGDCVEDELARRPPTPVYTDPDRLQARYQKR